LYLTRQVIGIQKVEQACLCEADLFKGERSEDTLGKLELRKNTYPIPEQTLSEAEGEVEEVFSVSTTAFASAQRGVTLNATLIR
jgi:hypothetical protein